MDAFQKIMRMVRVNLEDKEHLEHLELQESREQQDLEGLKEDVDRPDLLVCQDLRARRDQLGLMGHLEGKVLLDLLVHLVTGVLQGFLAQLVLLVAGVQWGHRERGEILESLVRRDHLGLLDWEVPLVPLVLVVLGEKRVPLASLVLLALLAGLVTRGLLEVLVQWVLLVDLVCP